MLANRLRMCSGNKKLKLFDNGTMYISPSLTMRITYVASDIVMSAFKDGEGNEPSRIMWTNAAELTGRKQVHIKLTSNPTGYLYLDLINNSNAYVYQVQLPNAVVDHVIDITSYSADIKSLRIYYTCAAQGTEIAYVNLVELS